ncbi:erythromycin esterase family protein [Sphingomonas sp.]|uniref:erythromycin esterase family protein n=1 Tax=Sphingomonas sp. TaxID=28214 RepID=UPI002D7F2A94|nr:erythromycin esterase family protein [Sphingomonas sp.]HEU0044219.1 erythromycin esterase family protein [Sphingomonas sp.]
MADALSKAGVAASLSLAACASGEGHTAGALDGQDPSVRAASDVRTIVAAARSLEGTSHDYDPLLQATRNARFVLLGEATHGTHEFYRERARISLRLVREQGFRAIVIEGDWPDADRVNRYVRGLGNDSSAQAALSDFTDFPQWMWRNAEFRDFVEALRAHNATLPFAQRVGVYGMDVYNLFAAADAVVAYLTAADPPAADRARAQYRCFSRFRSDAARYGAAARAPARSCARQAAAVLAELRARPNPADPIAAEALFSAVRSAASVTGAEEYYRTAYGGTSAWNVRDRRMAATVSEIADHTASSSAVPGKVIIWAHNSHVGDARATDMPLRGELNLGQLLRERFGSAAFLLGFTTYEGTVIAAERWGGPHRERTLRTALPDSYAGVFHGAQLGDALILLPNGSDVASALASPRRKREVGVIYAPATELQSHYTWTRLSGQFDAVVHLDRTRAVTPL